VSSGIWRAGTESLLACLGLVQCYSTRITEVARAMTSCWISDVPSKIVCNSVREEQGNLAAGTMSTEILHRARNLCCIAARPHVEVLINDGAH